jgi:hypothetical protein
MISSKTRVVWRVRPVFVQWTQKRASPRCFFDPIRKPETRVLYLRSRRRGGKDRQRRAAKMARTAACCWMDEAKWAMV